MSRKNSDIRNINGSNAGKRGKPGRRIAPGTTKRLLKYMMKFKAKFILVAFCIVLVSLAQTESFLFLQKLIDDYIMPLVGQENPSYAGLIRAIIFLLSLYAIAVAANLIYSIVLVTIEQGTLSVAASVNLPNWQTAPVVVKSGATLKMYSASVTLPGALTMAGGSTLDSSFHFSRESSPAFPSTAKS